MAEDQQERTEEATAQRREDFRKRGQVAQTRELAVVMSLLGSSLLFWLLGRMGLEQAIELVRFSIGPELVEAARTGEYFKIFQVGGTKLVLLIAPIMGLLSVLAVMSSIVQVGILQNEEVFKFDLEKINPLNGFQKVLSLRSLAEGMKALIKLIIVGSVAYFLLFDQLQLLPRLGAFSIEQLLSYSGSLTVRLLFGLGVFMVFVAAADYLYQWWELEKQMRMTKQEVKEEHKSREGDPMIKARIRRIQREMASRRMMKDVPKADVIVTNPTHIAVALRYDPLTMAAPQVIAKGSGLIAEKIKEVAREARVPILENKPLARAIFKTLKIGQTIPRELFAAVAEVLSYVYRLKRKSRS